MPLNLPVTVRGMAFVSSGGSDTYDRDIFFRGNATPLSSQECALDSPPSKGGAL